MKSRALQWYNGDITSNLWWCISYGISVESWNTLFLACFFTCITNQIRSVFRNHRPWQVECWSVLWWTSYEWELEKKMHSVINLWNDRSYMPHASPWLQCDNLGAIQSHSLRSVLGFTIVSISRYVDWVNSSCLWSTSEVVTSHSPKWLLRTLRSGGNVHHLKGKGALSLSLQIWKVEHINHDGNMIYNM
jgi:hypothetical protein